MKFRVLSDKFVFRNETNDTISLVIKETNQILYLNTGAKSIILQNGEQSLEDIIDNMQLSPKDRVQAEADFKNMLYELECEEIVEVFNRDEEQNNENKFQVAGESDYIAIASFMQKYVAKKINYALVKYPKYYHISNVRSRQFNNYEYNIVKYENNEIVANLVVAPPNTGSGFTTTLINAIVFADSIEVEKRNDLIKEFLLYVTELFKSESNKLRFYSFSEVDPYYRGELLKQGFESTAILKNEINKKMDLEFLDYFIQD